MRLLIFNGFGKPQRDTEVPFSVVAIGSLRVWGLAGTSLRLCAFLVKSEKRQDAKVQRRKGGISLFRPLLKTTESIRNQEK